MTSHPATGETDPPLSEMDRAVRTAVRDALHPYDGLFDMEFARAGGLWWVAISPHAAGACRFDVAFNGGDTIYWSIGHASIEVFPVDADYIPYVGPIAAAVAEGGVEETGLRHDASIRVRSGSEILLQGGPFRIPWPWALRRVRRYAPYAEKLE